MCFGRVCSLACAGYGCSHEFRGDLPVDCMVKAEWMRQQRKRLHGVSLFLNAVCSLC